VNLGGEKYRFHAVNCTCKMAVCRCPVDFIVFYAQENTSEWIVERTSDKHEMARGSLEEMMALVDGPDPKFPNGRRAHWAEDMGRARAKIWELEYVYGTKKHEDVGK
jgi:hypothetical protein